MDEDWGQLSTVFAAEQQELDADMAGLVHVREQVPVASTVVELEPLEPESKEEMDVDVAWPKGDESSSKKPEFMTHTA